MNKKDVYQKLKELFLAVSEKFEDAKLKDGSLLRGELIPGAKLQLVAADGTITDAPDSEYELENGTKVSILNGVVDSIIPVVTDEPMANPTPEATPVATTETPATPVATTEPTTETETPEQENVEAMLPQIVSDLADRVAALEAALGDAKTANMEMSKIIEKMSKEPGAQPIVRTTVENVFAKESKDDYLSKLERISNFRK